MIVESPDALRAWLTTTLEPICDADPAALAKYVMALLKKDRTVQELKEFCVDQLDVFLQKETNAFVDCLFEAVEKKSYLHGSSSAGSAPSAPSQPPVVSQSAPSEHVTSTTTTTTANGSKNDTAAPSRQTRKRISPPPRESSSLKSEKHTSRSTRDRKGSRSPAQRERGSRRAHETSSGTTGKHEPENATVSSSLRGARHRYNREFSARRRPSRSRSPIRRTRNSRDSSPQGNVGSTSGGSKGKSDVKEKEPAQEGTLSSKENSSLETSPGKDGSKKKKSRCRDYDEKGYCMRGDLCPFDHGPDPVVVDDTALPSMIAMAPATKAPVTAPPPNFSVPPPGYAPLNPPPPGVDTYAPATTQAPKVTEGYNPESPALVGERMPTAAPPVGAYTVPPPPLPAVTGAWTHPPPLGGSIHPYGFTRPPPALGQKRELITVAEGLGMQGGPVPKRGRGRGVMDRLGPRPSFGVRPPYAVQHPAQRMQPTDNKTLEVRKIPPHMNNIAKLNEHFQKFGQIINIQVRYEGDPEAALITYQTKNQATAAYKSTAPILNNRFIKVFWHNAKEQGTAQEQQQQTGPGQKNVRDRLGQVRTGTGDTAEDLDTSLVEREALDKGENDGAQRTVMLTSKGSLTKVLYNPEALKEQAAGRAAVVPKAPTQPHFMRQQEYHAAKKQRRQEKEKKIALLQLQSKKNSLLTKQLEQQKLLVRQLEKTKDVKQKKELMKMLNTMKKSSALLFEEVKGLNSKLGEMARVATERDAKTKEQVEKEKLDLELELMTQSQAGEDTTDLHKRLTDIKQQLILLALKESSEQPLATSTPIQSTSGSSGAGRPPQHKTVIPQSSRLDKRPRNIVVEGFTSEEKDAIIQHLREIGDMEDLEFDTKGKEGGCRALVVYKTRRDAERAVSSGTPFKEDRSLTVSWGVQVKGEQPGTDESGGTEGTSGDGDGDGSNLGDTVVGSGGSGKKHRMSASELLASLGDDSDDSDRDKDDDFLEDDDDDEEDDTGGGRR